MDLIFDVKITDTDDNEHFCRVRVDEYIPPLPAEPFAPVQRESCEWVFCDDKGRFMMPSFCISDREDGRVEALLIDMIRDMRNARGEP